MTRVASSKRLEHAFIVRCNRERARNLLRRAFTALTQLTWCPRKEAGREIRKLRWNIAETCWRSLQRWHSRRLCRGAFDHWVISSSSRKSAAEVLAKILGGPSPPPGLELGALGQRPAVWCPQLRPRGA